MDRVQLPQALSHFEEAVYFLPLSFQKFLVLILPTSEGWKAESTLEPPSGFEHGTPGLGIQRLNHLAIAPVLQIVQKIPGKYCPCLYLSIAVSLDKNLNILKTEHNFPTK